VQVSSRSLACQDTTCPQLKGLDTNSDNTLDLNEAKAAATLLFDKLDTDKDGTLTAKDLQGRLSKDEFAAGDPDKDGTLTHDEYIAIVENRFGAANPDADGTIDCKEAQSKAGHDLLRLLDPANPNKTTVGYGNTTGGVQSPGLGTQTANAALLGNYMASSLTTGGSGAGITVVADPAKKAPPPLIANTAGQHA